MLSAQHWQCDLHYIVEKLNSSHPKLRDKTAATHFQDAASALDDAIPSLLEHQVIVKMQALLALLHDGFTQFAIPINPTIAFQHFPIKFCVFQDGIFIAATTPLYQDMLCNKLLKIDNKPINSVIKMVNAVCPIDEAIKGIDNCLPYLVIPEVLHTLGIIDDVRKAHFLIEDAFGEHQSIEVEALSFDSQTYWIDGYPLMIPRMIALNDPQNVALFALPHSEIVGCYSRCYAKSVIEMPQRYKSLLGSFNILPTIAKNNRIVRTLPTHIRHNLN